MNAYNEITNLIDDIAKTGRKSTEKDLLFIKELAKENRIYVDDFADANDCGKCFTWEEVIGAFRCLWTNGERVEV